MSKGSDVRHREEEFRTVDAGTEAAEAVLTGDCRDGDRSGGSG